MKHYVGETKNLGLVLLLLMPLLLLVLPTLSVQYTPKPRLFLKQFELALELSSGAFRPSRRTHLPGVCNRIADILSRKFDPNKVWELPQALQQVPECSLPVRDKSYYVSLIYNDRFA